MGVLIQLDETAKEDLYNAMKAVLEKQQKYTLRCYIMLRGHGRLFASYSGASGCRLLVVSAPNDKGVRAVYPAYGWLGGSDSELCRLGRQYLADIEKEAASARSLVGDDG